MTSSWRKKARLYKQFDFHPEIPKDYSEQAAEQMFQYESTGKCNLSSTLFHHGNVNGYYYGKRWMDWQISAWREGIRQRLFNKFELWEDLRARFPFSWIRSALDLHVSEQELLKDLDFLEGRRASQ